MNALKVKRALQRREAEAHMKKVLQRNAEQFLEEHEAQEIERQKYNAMMHVLQVFILLNREFGFGKVRLGRLWDALVNDNKDFRQGLYDGIGWSKIFGELERIKFYPVDEQTKKYLVDRFQRLYEVGVRHYGEGAVSEAELMEETRDSYIKRKEGK